MVIQIKLLVCIGKELLEEVRRINREKATLVSKDKTRLPPNPEKPVVKALGKKQ